MVVLGTEEEEPKTKKNGENVLKKPKPIQARQAATDDDRRGSRIIMYLTAGKLNYMWK